MKLPFNKVIETKTTIIKQEELEITRFPIFQLYYCFGFSQDTFGTLYPAQTFSDNQGISFRKGAQQSSNIQYSTAEKDLVHGVTRYVMENCYEFSRKQRPLIPLTIVVFVRSVFASISCKLGNRSLLESLFTRMEVTVIFMDTLHITVQAPDQNFLKRTFLRKMSNQFYSLLSRIQSLGAARKLTV